MKNFIVFVTIISIGATLVHGSNDNERKPYIVYMGELSRGVNRLTVERHHHDLLADTIGDVSLAREAKIYSYGKSFNGFVARLLPNEASRLVGKKNVVSVFPNTIRKLLTTRSWDFLGMPENTKQRNIQTESNIIVGVLDTGIYVDSPSFDDKGYGPPPPKWKGRCEKGQNFTGCNRKVIGARYYDLGEDTGMESTPADTDGHGTHTSSTAAGNSVQSASLYGVANGTARGGAPGARIASYKVCGNYGCSDMSLLAGFDDAIADGVDVISVSIGSSNNQDMMDDVVSIGSFHAMKKGILTVCAGGNEGPDQGTVGNVAPWIFTVAATNTDRGFLTSVKLGNGIEINGMSINTFLPRKAMYPLTSSDLAYNGTISPYTNTSTCDLGYLDENKVKGKIVLCLGHSSSDYTVKKSRGVGTIIAVDESQDLAATTLIPASFVSADDGIAIGRYINSTKSPLALIHKTITVDAKAPVVASFSARGPQTLTKNLLKPDISAPGTEILAGYSKLVSITNDNSDNRFSYFNILSGTSMACPHISGAAAYVKSFHPDWSPAAIKSALMTTAKPVNGAGPEDPLSSGAGLLSPIDAIHPGLVYDLSLNDYIRYLCSEGYNGTTLALMGGHDDSKKPRYNCSKFKPAIGVDGINYPSMHVQVHSSVARLSVIFHRTVTHVGYGPAVYRAKVTSPKDISIVVIPDVLTFTDVHQKRSFNVVVKGVITEHTPYTFTAFLEWEDSKHNRVRSPILIYRPIV